MTLPFYSLYNYFLNDCAFFKGVIFVSGALSGVGLYTSDYKLSSYAALVGGLSTVVDLRRERYLLNRSKEKSLESKVDSPD